MTEQELREKFENEVRSQHILIKNKDLPHIYIDKEVNMKWIYFKQGYSLAQETIAELESRLEQSVDISVVNELNETIKTKDAEVERLKNQEIAEARELIKGLSFYTKRVCGENRLDLDLKREYLRRANSWLKDNC